MLCSTGKVKSESVSRSVMSTWPPKLFCPCDFPGKNIRVGCHFLLQECFLNQGSNPGLPGCRQILYSLSQQASRGNSTSLCRPVWEGSPKGRRYMFMQDWFMLLYSRNGHGEGDGTPLQYSCLENPMDGGAW